MGTVISVIIVVFTFSTVMIFVVFVAEGIKIEVGQQTFDMVYHLLQFFGKFVEILFIDEQLVAVVTIAVKAFLTLSDRDVVIVTARGPYIKEIRSAPARAYLPGKYAVVPLAVFVLHNDPI